MKRAELSLYGKDHLECCPLPQLAGNEDSAIVSPHDPENGRQAEATAGKLGCKEGIENPGLSGFVHSASGIPHFRHDVGSRRRLIAGEIPLAWRGQFLLGS